VILDEILRHKRAEVAERRARQPQAALERLAARTPEPRDFVAAVRGPDVRLIAEVKRRSPARGDLDPGLDPARLAREYVAAGASAVSVLTDGRFFSGSDGDLRAVRAAVGVPLLRKDFLLDPYQVWEARALGADAVLLIVRALDDEALGALGELAGRLGMAALFEVHAVEEVARALAAGARLVGINNRDLGTLGVDLGTTFRLRPLVPSGVVVVSESGIRDGGAVRELRRIGVDAVLVGEALVTAADRAGLVRDLVAAGRATLERPA
jgi:indole-3-glycerol phosphate synthase